jgi:hypothetical protein
VFEEDGGGRSPVFCSGGEIEASSCCHDPSEAEPGMGPKRSSRILLVSSRKRPRGGVIRQEVRIGRRGITKMGVLVRGVLLVLHLVCIN